MQQKTYNTKKDKSCPKAQRSDRPDGLSARPLCQCWLELPHRQLDDLIFVLLVFDGHNQSLHVEINLHVFKLKKEKKNWLRFILK